MIYSIDANPPDKSTGMSDLDDGLAQSIEIQDLINAIPRRGFVKIALTTRFDIALAFQVDKHFGMFDPA